MDASPMSAHLVDPSPQFAPVKATHYLHAQLRHDAVSIGATRRGEGATVVAAEALSSLEAFPWLAPSGPGLAPVPGGRSPAARERIRLMLHVGLAAALALLGGGVWYAAGDTVAPHVPAVQQAPNPHGVMPAAPSAAAKIAEAETAAMPVEAPQITAAPAAQPGREGQAARPVAATQSGVRTTAAGPRVAPVSAAGDAATTPESVVAPPRPPLADTTATTATLRQYRKAMDECHDTIRAIIRLGDRQRPGRDASAAELANYRLRQQNAEAAKTYRVYLDTLARSMRGANSETLTRQSLERARQTRGYLDTMLADSKAALR